MAVGVSIEGSGFEMTLTLVVICVRLAVAREWTGQCGGVNVGGVAESAAVTGDGGGDWCWIKRCN